MELLGEEEAQAAAEERATDVAELGYVPGELVVIYEDTATDAQVENALDSIEGEETSDQVDLEVGTMATVEISDELTVETAAEIIEADPAVKYAVPNYIAESYDNAEAQLMSLVTNITSDTVEKYENQWHLDFVKAPQAWTALENTKKSFEKVKVAIIDTGASKTHSDLANMISADSIEVVYTNKDNPKSWTSRQLQGDGYTNGGSIIQDTSSHGTHVSGIVGAQANNNGVLGVASGGATKVANTLVDLLVIDAFSLYVTQPNGSAAASATLQDIMFALDYAAKYDCKVANLSLGFPTTDENLNKLLEDYTAELTNKQNMVLVAAAGNGGNTVPSVPAMCANVLAVTNVTKSSTRATTSSYGEWCDIAAPGENILSTLHYKDSNGAFRDGYGTMSGTSMASPVVAGVAAMVRAANPDLKAYEVNNILCTTATAFPTSVNATGLGSGIVNAQAAVNLALSMVQTGTTTPTPQPIVLSSSNVTLSASSFAYTGYAQRPTVTVRHNNQTLKLNTHYTVTYGTTSSSALGSYFITVQGKGSYSGKITKRYTIAAANLSGAQVTAIPSQKYTGRALTPTVTVRLNGRTLTKNTDYTVTYANNINAGTASATIRGKGNYAGTKVAYFTITKPATTTTPTPQATTNTKPTPGWQRNGATWKYVYSNGSYARGWASISGSWYYFDNSSNMVTGWQSINGTWYYFRSGGNMATGWERVGSTWYYFRSGGNMATGWERVGNTWYYFYSSGAMATGWVSTGGTWYHMYSSGAMATGWVKSGNTWYYMRSGGNMATGWEKVGNTWYYFYGGGNMATGWVNDRGTWYYMYGSGAMATNTWVGNYYVQGSGAMATNTWIGRYHVNGSGVWDATR